MGLKTKDMIGSIVMVVVGLIFLPIVQDSIDKLIVVQNGSTEAVLTGMDATLLGFIPMFYVLAILFVAIAWAMSSAKKSG